MSRARAKTQYTLGEEILNTATHGFGAVASAIGLVFLVSQATVRGELFPLVAALVFGVSLVTLYSASAFYHGIPWPRVKRTFQTLDHVAIYLLIAGTYTPFALITLGERIGWLGFAVIWSLAAAGIAFELITRGRRMKLALVFYLAMGWVAVFVIRDLMELMSWQGLTFLFLGGLFYTVGAVFYAWKRLPYNHAIWHVFVLAGSASHFYCIIACVL
jgi:hemolysin III